MRFDLGTLDSGERSLPFGLLLHLYYSNTLNLNNLLLFAMYFQTQKTQRGSRENKSRSERDQERKGWAGWGSRDFTGGQTKERKKEKEILRQWGLFLVISLDLCLLIFFLTLFDTNNIFLLIIQDGYQDCNCFWYQIFGKKNCARNNNPTNRKMFKKYHKDPHQFHDIKQERWNMTETNKMSQLMRLWYLKHRRTAKALVRLLRAFAVCTHKVWK